MPLKNSVSKGHYVCYLPLYVLLQQDLRPGGVIMYLSPRYYIMPHRLGLFF